ncbi:MAG: hypothetical protein Q9164_003080 [Protoblastenia rupestris]
MLALHKASRSHRLSTNSSTGVLYIASRSNYPQSLDEPTRRRAFSWGAKSKWGSHHAGKVYKGFYTRYTDAQRRHSKQASIHALDRHFLNVYRSRSSPGFRPASSWKKADDTNQLSDQKKQFEEERGEDWYSRWERQKRKRYDEFVMRVEQDPYQALFGASNKWLGWLDGHVSRSREPNALWPGGQAARPTSKTEKIRQEVPPSKDGIVRTSTRPTRDTNSIDPSPIVTRNPIVEEQDYEIDPITLRKVPKQSHQPAPGMHGSAQTADKAIHISVKTFRSPPISTQSDQVSGIPSSQTKDSSKQTTQGPKNWLVQEGFSERKPPSLHKAQATQQNASSSDPGGSLRIESALDRHFKANDNTSPRARTAASEYQTREDRRDDVNLLRTSDVRASAGLKDRQVRETDADKQTRQKALEDQYEKRPAELEDRLAQEMASSSKNKQDNIGSSDVVSNPEASSLNSSTSLIEHQSKSASPKMYPLLTSGQVGKIRAKLVPLKTKIDMLKEDYAALRQQLLVEKRRIEEKVKKQADMRARELLDQEIKTQKAAMQAIEMCGSRKSDEKDPAPSIAHEELHGEGDMASNVHEFAGRARWYKRTAPHAQCEKDEKLRRLAREKAFVQEIRGIYEETFGVIDTNHRQPPSADDGARNSSTMTNGRSPGSEQDARVLGLFPSKDIKMDAQYLLPIEKELSAQLQSLQFTIEDCKQRASGESDRQKLATIHNDYRRAAEQCRRKLLLAGHQIRSTTESMLLSASEPKGPSSASETTIPNSLKNSQVNSPPTQSTTQYRILAYEKSAQKVNSATISSQVPFVGEKPLTPLQALNLLNNPGKFLPHITTLHSKGYDIISGASNILVLKKVRDAIETKEDYFNRPNPIDGTTTPEVSTGNFASPTGFVNHNPVIQPEELEQRQNASSPRSTDKVRREEDVFSGQSRRSWQDGKRTNKKDKRKAMRKKTFRRMLMTGTLTAAACYTTGVVVEMFNT